jgi:hypothetical protein
VPEEARGRLGRVHRRAAAEGHDAVVCAQSERVHTPLHALGRRVRDRVDEHVELRHGAVHERIPDLVDGAALRAGQELVGHHERTLEAHVGEQRAEALDRAAAVQQGAR